MSRSGLLLVGTLKCCVTCVGREGTLACCHSSVWPRLGIPEPFPLHMEGKATFAGLQEPVLLAQLTLVPGTRHSLSVDALPGLGERGRGSVTLGVRRGGPGHALGDVGVVGAGFWSLPAPAGSVRSTLGLRAAAGIAAALEQRLGWQISPRGRDLGLLPLLKYFQHLTLSTTRLKGNCFRGKCLIQGTGRGRDVGSNKQQTGERIHKYLIRVKWVTSVCCDSVLLSPRAGFGRAGKHSRLLHSLSLAVQH